MTPERISRKAARRLALKAHLLDGRTRFPKGKEGVARTIEALGYVQIDTIAVVERAHHVTLWARCPGYHPRILDELHSQDRRVFEYMSRALFYLPMKDFRYFLPRMKRFEDPDRKWEKDRLKKYGHLIRPALERLRKDGPASTRELAERLGTRRTSDNLQESTKSILRLMHLRGDVMVTERRNFHRVYDVTERVVPRGIDTSLPTSEEVGRYCVQQALTTFGLASEPEIRHFSHAADSKEIATALKDLIECGEVMPLKLEGDDRTVSYALAGELAKSKRLRPAKPAVHILSPFDSLIIQREWVKRLFDFEFTLECYLPSSRRKMGYFVHPILHGEELMGRLDPKADRKNNTLLIQSLLMEPGVKVGDDFLRALAARLWEFARFNGCEKVSVVRTSPAGLKKKLERGLAKTSPY